MKLAAIIALILSSPADAEVQNWLDVKVDSVEMRLPDLPTLSLHWPYGTEPETLENANRFILDRGVSYGAFSPMDSVVANLSSKVDLGRITLISVGPVLPKSWSDNVSCSEEVVRVLDHEVTLFCFPLDEVQRDTKFRASLVSNQIQFFGLAVRLNCSYLQLSNNPHRVICRLRSQMPNGLAVTVDLYLNEQENWAWPNLHGSLEDWQSNIDALETALTSMLVK